MSLPVVGTGAAARTLLAREGFDWRVFETTHARLHAARRSRVFDRAPSLADSVEQARKTALSTLEESDLPGEPKIEVFLLDTREDMKRITGRTISGFALPGELTAVFAAGPGYKPLIRHELTHAISFVRWGELRGGQWRSEGVATLAQGNCQGHSTDEIAAGYLTSGKLPSVASMLHDFRGIGELQGYIGAASFADHLRRRYGIATLRALWQGRAPDSLTNDLAKADGGNAEREWRAALRGIAPANLDSARLYREGC
ncbi:MAG TPA: hypothetical protein VES88_10160 [Gemmatimonadaceae bacterium]|nr:hypothetical protein [Gemmatimonadaceae bacterium]